MDRRVRIRLHPSRQYLVLLLTLSLLTELAISNLPMAFGWHLIACTFVFACLGWVWWRDIYPRSPRAIIAMICGTDGRVSLEMRNGALQEGVLLAETLVTPWLISLNIDFADHKKQSLLLFPDAMPAEDHRRLRVILRNATAGQL